MRNGIMSVGLEDLEKPAVEVEPHLDRICDTLESGDEAFESSRAEAMEHSEFVDHALSTGGALSGVAEKVEETLPEGGMSEPAADALRIAVEALCVSVNFSQGRIKKTFPAMEEFAQSTGRLGATKAAMEGIADRAKDIGKKIIEAIKKAVAYFFEFAKNMFDQAARYQKTAGQLAKLAASKSHMQVEKGEFIDLPPTLWSLGRKISSDNLLALVEKHVSQKVLTENRAKKLAELPQIVDSVGKNGGWSTKAEALGGGWSAVADALGKWEEGFDHGDPLPTIDKTDKTHYYQYKLVFGGKTFFTNIGFKSTISTATVGWDAVSMAREKSDEFVSPFQPSQVVKAAKLIEEHLRKVYAETKGELSEAKKGADKILSMLQKELDDSDFFSWSGTLAEHRIKSAINLTLTATTSLRAYDLTVCKSVLAFCASSLKKLTDAPEPV